MKGRPNAFPKELRLRRRAEFLRVQERGSRITADCLLCLVLPGPKADGPTRLGLTVSTRVGNAVVRNRVRRRLREYFRTRKETLPPGLDLVFIARPSAATADSARLRRSWDKAVAGLGARPTSGESHS